MYLRRCMLCITCYYCYTSKCVTAVVEDSNWIWYDADGTLSCNSVRFGLVLYVTVWFGSPLSNTLGLSVPFRSVIFVWFGSAIPRSDALEGTGTASTVRFCSVIWSRFCRESRTEGTMKRKRCSSLAVFGKSCMIGETVYDKWDSISKQWVKG